jgi:uncharacterized protein (TIRG00374 family)
MKYIKVLIILAIVALTLFFFFQNVDFNESIKIISSINWIYPLVFFLGLYLQFFIRAYRWGLLLKPHKKKISMWTLYNYTVIGFLLNMLPGKVGEAARGILLASEEKISRSYGLASVVLERLIDMLMLLVIFMISLFFMPGSDSPMMNKLKTAAIIVFPFVILFFFLFYLLNTERMFNIVDKLIRFFARLAPERFRERLIRFAHNFVKGLQLNLSVWDYIKLVLSSALVWLWLVPCYWFLMQAFEFGKAISLVETVPFFCVLVVSAGIPTPGMAGSFEAASLLGLKQLYGVDANAAGAYTILAHFFILAVMVTPGLIAFWTKGLHMHTIKALRQKEEAKEENENENETPGDGVNN